MPIPALFWLIGLLMMGVAGVGTYSAVENPGRIPDLGEEVRNVAKRVVSEVSHSTGIAKNDTNEQGSTTETAEVGGRESSSTGSADGSSIGRGGEREDDEEEGDDDEEEDDDRGGTRPSGTTQSTGTTSGGTTSGTTGSTGGGTTGSGQTSTVTSYTMAQVAQHHSTTDCWTAVNGSVYNLTPFVTSHPGGVANITKLCGIDGTAQFTAQHGGAGRPESELASLKIGALSK